MAGKSGKNTSSKGSDWNWIILILLLATGMWPFALVWLGIQWLFGRKDGRRPEDRVRQVQQRMDDTIDEVLRKVSADGQGEDGTPKPSEEVEKAESVGPRVRQRSGKKAGTGRKRMSAAEKRLQKVLGNEGSTMRVAGIVCMVLSVLFLMEPIDDLIWLGTLSYSIGSLIWGLNLLIGGGIMFGRGLYLKTFGRRCRKYVAAIGSADALPIDLIAKRTGRKYDQSVRDLEKMIEKGCLGDDAYVDLERGYFLRFGAEEELQGQKEQPAPQEADEGYSGVLRRIRRANDRIADPELSAKIDRLEQITGQILKEVETHPEKRAKMGTFFDYYLPTTQKLLDTYADFEETGVEGENLRAAKQRIEQTMDSIVEGFAHQLDTMFRADAMDVVSDIKVMETMLHRDTGSAAKDFGYEDTQA